MAGYVGSKEINEVYYGGREVSEIYKGSDLIYSSYQPVSNFLFRDIDANGKLTMPSSGLFEDASGITKSPDYLLNHAFYECSNLSGAVHFSNLKAIIGRNFLEHAFSSSGIIELSFNALKEISGTLACNGMCSICTNLASISLPELEDISGSECLSSAFYGCTGLTNVTFPKLKYISGALSFNKAFYGCTNLVTITFPELVSINTSRTTGNDALAYTFQDCSSLKNITFPKLFNIFDFSVL